MLKHPSLEETANIFSLNHIFYLVPASTLARDCQEHHQYMLKYVEFVTAPLKPGKGDI